MTRTATVTGGREPAACPPRLGVVGPDPAKGARWLPAWLGLVFVAAILAARLATHWHLPFPECWLRKLTGIPCPTCGCTRSLLAWSHLDLAQAFQFNPLFFLACAGLLAWAVIRGAGRVCGRDWLPRWRPRMEARRAWLIAGSLLALNWLYLCLTLPK